MLITELVINRPIRDVLDLLVTPDLAPLAVCPHDSLYDWLRLIPRRRPSSSAVCIELIDCPRRFCPFLGLPEGSSRDFSRSRVLPHRVPLLALGIVVAALGINDLRYMLGDALDEALKEWLGNGSPFSMPPTFEGLLGLLWISVCGFSLEISPDRLNGVQIGRVAWPGQPLNAMLRPELLDIVVNVAGSTVLH